MCMQARNRRLPRRGDIEDLTNTGRQHHYASGRRKLRVGFDLDGVLYPFASELARFVSERTGRPLESMGRPSAWDFGRQWGLSDDEFRDLFERGVDAGVVWARGEPLPGAVDAVRSVKADGHSVHLVTARFVGRQPQGNTERWLMEHGIPYDSITYTDDKTVVRTDFFLDDKAAHVMALRRVGCKAFLLDTGLQDQLAQCDPSWVLGSIHDFVAHIRSASERLLIGLSGYARSGKDSFAQALVSRHGFTRAAFADVLKQLSCEADPFICDGKRLSMIINEMGWEVAKEHIPETRQFLQRLGESTRNILYEDVWVDALLNRHSDISRLVISDVRYPNEVEAIRSRGGVVVRIVRHGVGPANSHISETALDNVDLDAVVVNCGSLDDLALKADSLLSNLVSGAAAG